MKQLVYIFFSILLSLFSANSFCQTKVDSLEKVLVHAKDTSRIRTLLRIAKEYNSINPDKSTAYYDEAIKLSLALPDSDCLRSSYRGTALVCLMQSDYIKGVDYASRALKIKGKKYTPSDDAD